MVPPPLTTKSNPEETTSTAPTPQPKPETEKPAQPKPVESGLSDAVKGEVASNLSTAIKPSESVKAGPKSYIVQRRDNLWSIATQHGISVNALRQANPGLRSDALKVGRELVIP